MKKVLRSSFTIPTIFIICLLVFGAMVNGQCTLSLPVGPNGICVPKDCKSLCHQKYKGGGRCTPEKKDECLCFICKRP
ncbi:defensin-like protein 144 [Arabidopsis lyrata subsp. lyrata]|nr:defensin-like protein 144 [Arabidopsis lyrata subsp. lyrata]|eukprot:XP_020888675.1 defensin-like protein 144 [Arabidopsis lyrata subsp. lyrata]